MMKAACFLGYGLGRRAWSAGIADRLGPKLRVIPGVYCPFTFNYDDIDKVADAIDAIPASVPIALMGHSLFANNIPKIAAVVSPRTIALVVGYDPSIFATCPAIPANVKTAICFHGMNWLNPIGHALYTVADPRKTTLTTIKTWDTHTDIDDDDGLHGIAVAAFKKLFD